MFKEDIGSISEVAASETAENKVVGVIQMINKVSYDGQFECFDDQDVEVMELFAKFVGPKLTNSSMLSKRHSVNPEKVEAELALSSKPVALGPTPCAAKKRMSQSAMDSL